MMPRLDRVHLRLGQVLAEPGHPLEHFYFPVDCIISLIGIRDENEPGEVAIVGHEGLLGLPVLMGGDSMPWRAVVQCEGAAYRMKVRHFKEEIAREGDLNDVLMRYALALFAQVSQTAICNRHHCLEQRLCRWLLLSLDCVRSDELIMTHELLAEMLGVRREGVTTVAGRLQKQGVIQYRRGRIILLDRGTLERLSCRCYGIVKQHTQKLFPGAIQTDSADRCWAERNHRKLL